MVYFIASTTSRFVTFELRHLLAAFGGLATTSLRFVTFELRHLLAAFEGLATTRPRSVTFELSPSCIAGGPDVEYD